ncbi:hypothetical protein [Nocardia cyriacigeorgica]|uniref:hypothetical protein n=1 Tax=Nocardia cyriacigeorgica TaxID=135487 RepID=UPI00158E8165|nr:hypothetical protein [Nocardia cyriacigeorgica]
MPVPYGRYPIGGQLAAALADGSGELGDAWERLAELAVGYDDLASEVAAGRRRLPGPP